jgi:hypothetical protein
VNASSSASISLPRGEPAEAAACIISSFLNAARCSSKVRRSASPSTSGESALVINVAEVRICCSACNAR